MKILLKNALIYDGSDNKPYKANIVVDNQVITDITDNIIPCDKEVDCTNKIVTPGFIDVHGHSELRLAALGSSMSEKVNQGITTEICGNCGIGCFPLNNDCIDLVKENVKDVLGDYEVPWSWTCYNGFTNFLSNNGMSFNLAFLTSHSALRFCVLKDNIKRSASKSEIKKMCELLDQSLLTGSCGFSTGLYYSPCVYSDERELEELLKVVKKHDKYFTVHHKCEGGDHVLASLTQVLELSYKVGVKLEISHLKVIGLDYQEQVDKVLELINSYREKGLNVGFDQYPFNYGSTSLYSLLPPSVLGNPRTVISSILQNKKKREEIKQEILEGKDFDSIIKLCGFDNIKILSLDTHPEYKGKTLTELSEELRKEPFELLFDILSLEKGSALMMDITQSEESIIKIMKNDLTLFGSDALYSGTNFHKRSYVASIKRLMYYKDIPLEFLISRATGFSALRFNIKDRGFIRKNYKADINIIDLEKLNLDDTSAIETVIINGKIVKENSEFKENNCGKIINL